VRVIAVLALVFVAILFVGAIFGLFVDGSLQQRERAFGEALERHPVAAGVVEDIAERNELDLRDIVRSVPDATPEEFDAALGAVEQRKMTTGQLEAAIAPGPHDD
jgi:hypothetical protein